MNICKSPWKWGFGEMWGASSSSQSGGLHNILREGDCHVSINETAEQWQSGTGPPVLQGFPPKLVEHIGHTCGGWEVVHCPSSSSALQHFKFGGQVFGVGVQCACCVFKLWSDKCFVTCWSDVLVFRFDVSFDEAKWHICFAYYLVYMCVPFKVWWYIDPEVFSVVYYL